MIWTMIRDYSTRPEGYHGDVRVLDYRELRDMLLGIYPDADIRVNSRYYFLPEAADMEYFLNELYEDQKEWWTSETTDQNEFASSAHCRQTIKRKIKLKQKRKDILDPEHELYEQEIVNEDTVVWAVGTFWGTFNGSYGPVIFGISADGSVYVVEGKDQEAIQVSGDYPVKAVRVYC